MLVPFLLSMTVAGIVFLAGEYTRRRLGASNEASRKLVHAIHGMLVAIWPFIIGYKWTIVIEVLFILSALSARHFHWFRWMWRVGRKSWGEFLYPLGVIVIALTAPSKWVYLAAALELALADSAAAMIGKRFGRRSSYKVFGQAKSLAGSAAFFAVSCVALGSIIALSPLDMHGNAILAVFGLSALLMVVESFGVYGADNFLIPVVAVAALNLLS